jgi:exosortase
MYTRWTGPVWQNNHGLLVAVTMVLMAKSVVFARGIRHQDGSAWGFLFLLVGALLVLADMAVGTRYIASVGVALSFPGLSLLLLGKKKTWALLPVHILAFFLIPMPNDLPLQVPLRLISATGTKIVLQAIGTPVEQIYTYLGVPNNNFMVVNACSGLATVLAATAISVILISTCTSPLRRLALLVMFIPLALAANVLRVLVMVLVRMHLDPSFFEGPLHEASGVVSFGLILVVLMLVADRPRIELKYSG